MAPFGDGALNLPQQVKAGQRGSWEEGEEGRDALRRERRERETISFLSLLFIPAFCCLRTFIFVFSCALLFFVLVPKANLRRIRRRARGEKSKISFTVLISNLK